MERRPSLALATLVLLAGAGCGRNEVFPLRGRVDALPSPAPGNADATANPVDPGDAGFVPVPDADPPIVFDGGPEPFDIGFFRDADEIRDSLPGPPDAIGQRDFGPPLPT